MLVLTRKAQQQIRVGENVVITVLRIKGGSVRIGIDAPKNVRVVRAELPKLPASGEVAEVIEVAPGKPVTVVQPREDQSFSLKLNPTASRPALKNPVAIEMGLARHVARRSERSERGSEVASSNMSGAIGFGAVVCSRD